ncbi:MULTISPECIES: hypothetical protein [unclassified Paenibacillus]|uniref:hypothetical protein n=1 Tax=unclassified Paenibacillus TaxID=185978 RepID=UPI00046531B9|nr:MULTISPECIES: hypothetical protein [unclassified Paenibacillus]KGP81721.1 hypothetical protein P364_0115240 [Paenibacillus sp. MAEPY2]KGP86003.1 hypothetical protein P363_0120130 [Paenibacillus sp. MAEPY1]
MASFVLLIKEMEDEEKVIYKFGPNENVMGRIELNKITRKFTKLDPIPDPNIATKFYFDRAAQRLSVCFIRQNGFFPNRTTFES